MLSGGDGLAFELFFLVLSQQAHVEIARAFDPLFMGLGGQGDLPPLTVPLTVS